ncbi:signal peptide peptidase [Pelomyxa schiedti]|nr:signal peptide peptidase [Pelomyxa schiedti]
MPALLLFDPATFALVFAAVGTIVTGSYKSSAVTTLIGTMDVEAQESSKISMKMAIILPILGSIVLVILFYFLKIIYYFLLVLFCITATIGVSFVAYPLVESMLSAFSVRESIRVRGHDIPVAALVVLPVSLLPVLPWVFTLSWPLSNFLALCMGVLSVAGVRLPSLKVSLILLILFFLYDVFWVFFSAFIFGESVMVTVAVGLTPEDQALPMILYLPRILSEGASILGLGDIILPGIYLCLLYRVDLYLSQVGTSTTSIPQDSEDFSVSADGDDVVIGDEASDGVILSPIGSRATSALVTRPLTSTHERRSTESGLWAKCQTQLRRVGQSYFVVGIIAYISGLYITFIMLIVTHYGQPALLYLVPAILISSTVQAYNRGHLRLLWTGIPDALLTTDDIDIESGDSALTRSDTGAPTDTGRPTSTTDTDNHKVS